LPGELTMTLEDLRGLALSTIKSVLGSERYQYLSGPITGGKRLVEWHSTSGRGQPKSAVWEPVIKPNLADVIDEAARQRANGFPTIEPASFEARGKWEQSDYLAFWDKVIELHSEQVRFMDGWEYSAGCAFEYCRALAHGIPTFDLQGGPLDAARAIQLLDSALMDIAARFTAGDPLDQRLEELHARISTQRNDIEARR
jgi:hypothetical protein